MNRASDCAAIARRFPQIDIGFIQMGGVTMYPGCFRMTEQQMRKEATRRKIGYADQRRMVELIEPKRLAPFAADFCWLDDRYFHNNLSILSGIDGWAGNGFQGDL